MFRDMKVVALEEHYWDAELIERTKDRALSLDEEMRRRLHDFDTVRIEHMDRTGVDYQVLSHAAPSGQSAFGDDAPDLLRRVNDRLAAGVARRPDRFGAFAALPTADPQAAAKELERCVTQLGMKGAMIHGPTGEKFIDGQEFWPIFATAEQLDVPIYLHPATPLRSVIDAYYKDYMKAFPTIISAGWGFTVETATTAIRLILSGMFAKYPGTKIILGHFGESIPFLLWRIDQALSRPGQEGVKFRETFCNNFWLTSSGNFSTPGLLCCAQEMGMDKLMFSIDWPYVANEDGMDWIKTLQMNENDLRKFLGGNAASLLRL
jgi:2,3-dihydroxybenzoate decarboxylase